MEDAVLMMRSGRDFALFAHAGSQRRVHVAYVDPQEAGSLLGSLVCITTGGSGETTLVRLTHILRLSDSNLASCFQGECSHTTYTQHTHTHIYSHTHTYTHIYKHTHIHAYTHPFLSSALTLHIT